jgi:hypothetical protein
MVRTGARQFVGRWFWIHYAAMARRSTCKIPADRSFGSGSMVRACVCSRSDWSGGGLCGHPRFRKETRTEP